MSLPRPPLLVITDRRQVPGPLEEVAHAAFSAGCRWLSLREKDLVPDERIALLRRLVTLGRRWGAAVTVHDDVAAALAADAAGVHLPGGGSPLAARRRLGASALIGLSAHNAADIARAAAEGADYVTLSPVFASASKPGYGPALGLDGLAAGIRLARLPVIALGGIAEGNTASCIAAGAAGVAVMGVVMAAKDPALPVARIIGAMAVASEGRSCGPQGRRS